MEDQNIYLSFSQISEYEDQNYKIISNINTICSQSIQQKEQQQNKPKQQNLAIGKRKRQQNRTRKSEHQILYLINEFRRNPDWTKEIVNYLSQRTGLSESQVYKWNWDQRQKFVKGQNTNEKDVKIDVFGGYCGKRLNKADSIIDDLLDEDCINQLIGFDIEEKAMEIVKNDKLKRIKLDIQPKPEITIQQDHENMVLKKSLTPIKQFSVLDQVTKQDRNLIRVQENIDSNTKSTLMTENSNSILQTQQKSPIKIFDSSAFNIISPWKYDSSQIQNHIINQNNNIQTFLNNNNNSSFYNPFQLKTPMKSIQSPMKSPNINAWIFNSPFVRDDKEQYMENKKSSFCLLNFNQKLSLSPE